MEMTAQNELIHCSPIKQQWMSKTRIEREKPVDWLNVKHIGKATHFTSGYASHRFKINFPISRLLIGNYGFLTQIMLNCSTIGKAAITAVELHEGNYLLWKNDDLMLRGDHLFTLPSDNFWEIDPGLPFTDDLRLELVASFGAPGIAVPEFCFHAAHVRFACSSTFSQEFNKIFN